MDQGQVIREAVVDLLVAGVASAEGRVFPMRYVEYRKGELPAIGVYDTKGRCDVEAGFALREEIPRDGTLQIEVVVRLSEDIESEMDALKEQVELAMDQDRTFGGAAADSDYLEWEKSISTAGDVPVGIVTLTYVVRYYPGPTA